MSAAFLPSPTRAVWHLGPLPVRAYALCIVGGIVLGVWVASRRYVRAGGRPGVILDVAAWAVPCGLVGARLYSVITGYERYFGDGHDWLAMVKVSDGALALPGALAAGSAAAWFACRRAGGGARWRGGWRLRARAVCGGQRARGCPCRPRPRVSPGAAGSCGFSK